MKAGIYLTVDRCNCCGSIQVSINELNAEGKGNGYRIMGSSYNGQSRQLGRVRIDELTADGIRHYLDRV